MIVLLYNNRLIRKIEYENEREKTTSRNRLNINIVNYGSYEEENIPYVICLFVKNIIKNLKIIQLENVCIFLQKMWKMLL